MYEEFFLVCFLLPASEKLSQTLAMHLKDQLSAHGQVPPGKAGTFQAASAAPESREPATRERKTPIISLLSHWRARHSEALPFSFALN